MTTSQASNASRRDANNDPTNSKQKVIDSDDTITTGGKEMMSIPRI